jgi:hypothetical protein
MPSNPKFPPSAEIKRVIATAFQAGIEIGSIEIHPDKIVIHRTERNARPITAYDVWKAGEGENTEHVTHSVDDTDAPAGKPRG